MGRRTITFNVDNPAQKRLFRRIAELESENAELQKRLECPAIEWDEGGIATMNGVHIGYVPWRRKNVGCPRELRFIGDPLYGPRGFFNTRAEAIAFVNGKAREFWGKMHEAR